MVANSRVIAATEFKAKCLSILSEIEESGTTITITRRGKPIAVLNPVPKTTLKSPANRWKGRARIIGDIVTTDFSNLWNVVKKSNE